jgi:carboxylesterase
MQIIQRSTDPFFYSAGKTGILLIHGFTGSPSEMRPMGKYLHQQGFTVSAPLLPGHGTSPEDLQQTKWQDWWMCVKNAFMALQQADVEKIAVVGHSMGGILALLLASEYQKELTSVVTLCAPIIVRDFRANFVRLLHWFKPYIVRTSNDRATFGSL